MVKIIMMSGWAGSGKDTTADYLVEHKGYIRMAFADALKDTVSETRNIPREWMNTHEGKARVVNGKTVRAYLIEDGQEAREKDPAVWVKVVAKSITALPADSHVVISDWRLPNEYTILKELFDNVVRVRVNRFKEPPINDYTETALDKEAFEVVLENTGTREEFLRVLDNTHWEQLFP